MAMMVLILGDINRTWVFLRGRSPRIGPIPGMDHPVHEMSVGEQATLYIDVPNAHYDTGINKIYSISQFHVSMVGEFCKCRDQNIGVVHRPV